MGFQWPFRYWIASVVPEAQIVEKCRYSTAKPIIAQNTNLVAEKIAVPRTRGSVRRASGFVQIAISFINWPAHFPR
jgi:hypothetical protein